MRTLAAAFALTLIVSAPASATPFGWTIVGEFDTVNNAVAGPFSGLFRVGDVFTLALTMESSAPEIPGYERLTGCGAYTPITSMTFSSGNFSITKINPAQDYIVVPNPAAADGCFMGLSNGRIRGTFFQFGVPEANLDFQFHYTAQLPNDRLPTNPAVVTSSFFELIDGNRPIQTRFAHAGAIAVAVPEPGSVILISLGLMAWRRRRG